MPAPPLPFQWDGDTMVPRWPRKADEHYVIGQDYMLAPLEERSEASHRHEFAFVRDAWSTLPESLADEYPSAEFLRKRALIATGYCTVTDYVCGSNAEALRWATNLRREVDEYAVVIVQKTVVRVLRAKSQSRRAMQPDEFQASKTAILDHIAGLLDVPPDQLRRAA